jgi:hypothetical protein
MAAERALWEADKDGALDAYRCVLADDYNRVEFAAKAFSSSGTSQAALARLASQTDRRLVFYKLIDWGAVPMTDATFVHYGYRAAYRVSANRARLQYEHGWVSALWLRRNGQWRRRLADRMSFPMHEKARSSEADDHDTKQH